MCPAACPRPSASPLASPATRTGGQAWLCLPLRPQTCTEHLTVVGSLQVPPTPREERKKASELGEKPALIVPPFHLRTGSYPRLGLPSGLLCSPLQPRRVGAPLCWETMPSPAR